MYVRYVWYDNSWRICYIVSTESHVTIKYSHKTRNRRYWSMWITLQHYHEIKRHRTVNTARKHSAVTRKYLDVTNNSAIWNLAYTSWGLDISKTLYQILWMSWKMQAVNFFKGSSLNSWLFGKFYSEIRANHIQRVLVVTNESVKQGIWTPEWDSQCSNWEGVSFGNFFKDDVCLKNGIFHWYFQYS